MMVMVMVVVVAAVVIVIGVVGGATKSREISRLRRRKERGFEAKERRAEEEKGFGGFESSGCDWVMTR